MFWSKKREKLHEIEKGFHIENPDIFVPWNITEQELHVWVKDSVLIYHYVFDRFGPEEHVGIEKK